MVGREDVIGLPGVLRVKTAPYQVRALIASAALKIKAELLRDEFPG
ncbi:MAG: hypothetical protein ACREBC_22980 [Pyrinomonadaceae bacterium]